MGYFIRVGIAKWAISKGISSRNGKGYGVKVTGGSTKASRGLRRTEKFCCLLR